MLQAAHRVARVNAGVWRIGRSFELVDALYLVDEIDVLCRAKGVRLLAVVGPRNELAGEPTWLPAQYGMLTIQDLVPHIAESDLYVCGPQAVADLVIDDALAAGTPKSAIHNERFSW